jgi:hypothetical protein
MASIYLPLYDLRALNVIEDREYWPSYTKDRLTMIGVPNAKLFGGLTGEQITRLYYDNHLNANGMDYFTRAVLPGILKAYDEAVDHSPFERSLQP